MTMATAPLVADDLHRSTDPRQFSFRSTSELEDLPELIGQSRARDAIAFGVGIAHQGYNIFVAGPAGSGKQTLVRRQLDESAAHAPRADDWCYVFNFAEEGRRPLTLRLPAGRGATVNRGSTCCSSRPSPSR